MGFVPALLHRIHPLVGGFFSVGVHSCFPIDDVDIAGGKVYPVPEVIHVPIPETEHDSLVQNHPNIFTVSVLTRTQAHKKDQDFDLSDTLFASKMTRDSLPSTGTQVNCTLKEAKQVTECDTAPVPLPLTCVALIAAQKNPSISC